MEHDKEDRDVQAALGRARTVYTFSADYADETASKQLGISAEELAELVAATNDGPATMEIPGDEAAKLEAQIADQRALEQAAVKLAVDAANAEVEAAKLAQAEAEEREAATLAAAAEA